MMRTISKLCLQVAGRYKQERSHEARQSKIRPARSPHTLPLIYFHRTAIDCLLADGKSQAAWNFMALACKQIEFQGTVKEGMLDDDSGEVVKFL